MQHPDYLARVHIGLTDCLHGDLGGTGAAAEAVRDLLPDLHRNAFGPVLLGGSRGSSSELVDLCRQVRVDALDVYDDTVEVRLAILA